MIISRRINKTRSIKKTRPRIKTRGFDLIGVYVGYINNATDSAIISFQTRRKYSRKEINYRKEGMSEWERLEIVDETPDNYEPYHYNGYLEGLRPNSVYEIKINEFIRTFKTMPDTLSGGRELRILMTSDVSYGGATREPKTPLGDHMNVIKKINPDIAVLAGDVGHASYGGNATPWRGFWEAWLSNNENNEGNVLPMIVCYGNHEMIEHQEGYFTKFFPQIEGGYGAVDIGNYLTFLALNTNHTIPIADQVDFIEQQLAKKQDRLVVPLQHVSPYQFGKFRSLDEDWSKEGRELWTPIYTANDNVKFVFSGHSHTYGYTPPVTGDSLDPNGKIYIGQGGFGVHPRPAVSADSWWVDKVAEKNHVWLMVLKENEVRMQSYDLEGNLIDELQWDL